ncbi:DUF3558 domain-containing protein [Nocardia carnea]|uniref:DUF3558 domain-containing protein n=1 Tax=Nocardia carnea TaxID=37328 RepID=UPI0024545F05|nr:DUF3558 domain-containing protein [Nocardia carnea]
MRAADSIRAVVVIVASILAGAGCSGPEDEAASNLGPATATVGYTSSNLYHPCRDLGNDAVSAAGLDPASKSLDPKEEKDEPSMWRVCKWNSADHQVNIGVYATYYTLDHARQRSTTINKSDTTIAGRAAHIAQERSEPDSCYTSVDTDAGMFEFRATWVQPGDHGRSICEVSKEYATRLLPRLPDGATI